MQIKSRLDFTILAITMAGTSTGLWAQTAKSCVATSSITAVKLYPGVATIERTATVAANSTQYTFSCLPAGLDVESLQVSGGKGLVPGELTSRIEKRSLIPACQSANEARLQNLKEQIAKVNAEIAALELVQTYLKSTASQGREDQPNAASKTTTPIAQTAEILRRSAVEAALKLHPLQQQLSNLQKELAPLEMEIQREGGENATVMQVKVNLATSSDAEIRLSYSIQGPGWQPAYRAFLQSDDTTLTLQRLAVVAQNSGEDWSQVPLVLSTSQPTRKSTGRLPNPWTLLWSPPEPVVAKAVMPDMPRYAAAPAPAPAAALRSVTDNTPAMPTSDASVFNNGLATEFILPQRVSVTNNAERVTVLLGQQKIPVKLLRQIAPSQEASAYLVARFEPQPGIWPTGQAHLYRDGNQVGTTRLDMSATGGPSLSFGQDEKVIVQAEPEKTNTRTIGLRDQTIERQQTHRFRVENRHTSAIDLEILEASPVSQHAEVSVSAKFEPPVSVSDWNQKPGIVAWLKTLAAGASASFTADYTIRYPKEGRLNERTW